MHKKLPVYQCTLKFSFLLCMWKWLRYDVSYIKIFENKIIAKDVQKNTTRGQHTIAGKRSQLCQPKDRGSFKNTDYYINISFSWFSNYRLQNFQIKWNIQKRLKVHKEIWDQSWSYQSKLSGKSWNDFAFPIKNLQFWKASVKSNCPSSTH